MEKKRKEVERGDRWQALPRMCKKARLDPVVEEWEHKKTLMGRLFLNSGLLTSILCFAGAFELVEYARINKATAHAVRNSRVWIWECQRLISHRLHACQQHVRSLVIYYKSEWPDIHDASELFEHKGSPKLILDVAEKHAIELHQQFQQLSSSEARKYILRETWRYLFLHHILHGRDCRATSCKHWVNYDVHNTDKPLELHAFNADTNNPHAQCWAVTGDHRTSPTRRCHCRWKLQKCYCIARRYILMDCRSILCIPVVV